MRALIVGLVMLSASPGFAAEVDLDPKVIQNSPVLQRWQKQVPNVADQIKNDPSFRTRLRIGYASELQVGVEDLRIDRTNFTTQRQLSSVKLGRGFTLLRPPFGKLYQCCADRRLSSSQYDRGCKSRHQSAIRSLAGGGADISLTQSWVAPFGAGETGLTALSIGYAVTHNLRLSTQFQKQNSPIRKESRIGIGLEWMP